MRGDMFVVISAESPRREMGPKNRRGGLKTFYMPGVLQKREAYAITASRRNRKNGAAGLRSRPNQ